jgi:hypothetical protein
MSGSVQHAAMNQPHHEGGTYKEDTMSRPGEKVQRGRTSGPQHRQQLRLEPNMGELIGNDDTAK